MSEEKEVELHAKAVIGLFDMDGSIGVEMRLPEGQTEIDESSPAQMLMAWMATNWEALMTMFNTAHTKHQEAEQEKLLEPQAPKLVASDGKSLVQH
jgi:hypothetical protein